MDIEIHSSTGLACVIKSNRERLENLEKIVFANNNTEDFIDLQNVHIPDHIDNHIFPIH